MTADARFRGRVRLPQDCQICQFLRGTLDELGVSSPLGNPLCQGVRVHNGSY